MKFHLTRISLAVLSTVFMLGCQDLGSGPVGPDGPQFDKASDGPCPPPGRDAKDHCHGDDGDTGGNTNTGSIELAGGMTGTTGSIKIGRTPKKFSVYTPIAPITINLQAKKCVVTQNPDVDDFRANFLMDLLTDGMTIPSGNIDVGVDKTAVPGSSNKHNLIADASFPGVGGFRVGIPRFLEPTVSLDDAGNFVFKGEARAVTRDSPGQNVVVVCETSNSVTVIVNADQTHT